MSCGRVKSAKSSETNIVVIINSVFKQGIPTLSDGLKKEEEGVDSWTAVQAYNFRKDYIDYVAKHGGTNSLRVGPRLFAGY